MGVGGGQRPSALNVKTSCGAGGNRPFRSQEVPLLGSGPPSQARLRISAFSDILTRLAGDPIRNAGSEKTDTSR